MKKDNVTKFPLDKKIDETNKFLVVKKSECQHKNGTFEIDIDLNKCWCNLCKEEVPPMLALERLAAKESVYMRNHYRYVDEIKRLSKRSRTQCQHCKKMTRISRT